MRIFHPRLPWYIDVEENHPNGITVYDVVTQVHRQLFTQVSNRHFYNEDLDDSDRTALSKAFAARTRGEPELINRGIMRIDFLGIDKKFIWLGLLRGRNGLWEMKTKRVE